MLIKMWKRKKRKKVSSADRNDEINDVSVIFQVNSDWDAAINGILARSGGIQKWTLGAAAKCNIDEGSTFRCKFNTDLQLGLSLQQKLDENATLSLSFNIDCANVTRGGHKVGLAFEIEAWTTDCRRFELIVFCKNAFWCLFFSFILFFPTFRVRLFLAYVLWLYVLNVRYCY